MHECTPMARRLARVGPANLASGSPLATSLGRQTDTNSLANFSLALSLSLFLSLFLPDFVSHFSRKLFTGIMQTRAASYAAPRARARKASGAGSIRAAREALARETRQCLRAPDLCHDAVPASAALQTPLPRCTLSLLSPPASPSPFPSPPPFPPPVQREAKSSQQQEHHLITHAQASARI